MAESETAEPVRLSIDELRTLFLFESLSDEQLGRLSREGHQLAVDDGIVFSEGRSRDLLLHPADRWDPDVQAVPR